MTDFTLIHGRRFVVEPFEEALCKRGFSVDFLPTSSIITYPIPQVLKLLRIQQRSMVITWDVYISSSILALLSRFGVDSKGYIVRTSGDPLVELESRGIIKRTLESDMVLYGLKKSLAVLHNSKYLQRRYKRICPTVQHKTVYNAVDTGLFSPWNRDKELFDSYVCERVDGNKTMRGVCVMNFNIPRKLRFIPEIVPIVEKLSEKHDVSFYFMGAGFYLSRIRQMFRKCKNAFFMGSVPRTTLAKLLPLFDFFFYPSSLDALPNTVLEASASGIPSVSTAVGGIPEIILHEKTGLLARDPSQFHEYLRVLIEDSAIREELGRAAHRWVKIRFSRDAVGQAFLKEVIPFFNASN